MGLLKRAIAPGSVSKSIDWDRELGRSLGTASWQGFNGGVGTYDWWRSNDFENAFPSIRVIAQRFAAIEPYTVDKTGKSVASNILDRIYTPNNQMSAYDFREALAVMTMVHNKVYIRVHHRGTRITPDSITGFTFLEGVSERLVNGQLQYWLPNAEMLTPAEVIVLKSINPYYLNAGFSHAFAARRWTRLDDLIADFQTGFFDNGATPSGQFIITAKTKTDYKDIVNGIREHHQGARKSNGVMFAHRPIDPATNKPTDAQIEWVPFSTTNKDMALKDLFEQANKKIDSVYGVPASLRGVNDANTYASVRVDDQIFTLNTLEPFTLKIWIRFAHQLNLITGGTGVAIDFDLDVPVVADEEKVKAEAKQTDAQTLINLTGAGYELKSAVKYIATGDITVLQKMPKEQEHPDVLDSEEASDTPDQPVDLTMPSKAATSPKAKALSDEDRADYEDQLRQIVTGRMQAQVDEAMDLVSSKFVTPSNPIDENEDQRLYDEMLVLLLTVISTQGPLEHGPNVQLLLEAGIDIDPLSPAFNMTPEQEAGFKDYLQKVAKGYNAQTAERIRNIIMTGRQEGTSAADLKRQLKGLMNEDWRIDRLVISEVNHAGASSALWDMQNIAKQSGAKVEKYWIHTGGDEPCPLCLYMLALDPVDVTDEYVALGDTIELEDGTHYTNDFMPIDGSRDVHPHGHCLQGFRVVK